MGKKEMRDRLVQLCVKAYMFGGEQVIIDLPSLIGFVEEELDKAREEGRREVLSKIKEIFETNIPRGLYSPSETSYLYERFGSAIQQYYTHELSKLN